MRRVITALAAEAIVAQYDYYREVESERLATRWEKCVTETMKSLSRYPLRGAPGRFLNSELEGIRQVPVRGFPRHSIYYVCDESQKLTRIVHVLHHARDVEKQLQGSNQ